MHILSSRYENPTPTGVSKYKTLANRVQRVGLTPIETVEFPSKVIVKGPYYTDKTSELDFTFVTYMHLYLLQKRSLQVNYIPGLHLTNILAGLHMGFYFLTMTANNGNVL